MKTLGGGSGENENLSRLNMISTVLPMQLNPTTTISGEIPVMMMKKEDRVPQWSHQETRDFIAIRAELERDFTTVKRNKMLWENVAVKMKERGYRRSPDQCKCKWKNLVNRYKGKETSDPENGRHCPFFNELHAIFIEREKNMQRPETGGIPTKRKVKRLSGDGSSEDFTDDNEDGEDDSEEEQSQQTTRRSRKRKISDRAPRSTTPLRSSHNNSEIQEMLQEFFQQQQRMDMQWREVIERRARERQLFEQEWRESMEKLERERLYAEQAWREREEQRRIREENRAEKRDALLTTLLNKLIQGDHP